MTKCFHYCRKSFYNELRNKKISANNILNKTNDAAGCVKEYVFTDRKLNKGNGMFFAWTNPFYKGDNIFSEEGEFYLLELDIPSKYLIATDYQNWCSLGVDIWDVDGDLEEAEKVAREETNDKYGLSDRYEAIFITDERSEIQYLIKELNIDWVKSYKSCIYKYV